MLKFYCIASVMALSCGGAFASSGEPATIRLHDSRAAIKALPIYSNTLIDQAPEGEKITGIRDCYSAIMKGGESIRGFESGVKGEYVVGDDGCVYLRNVCYKAGIDTYLKLEKVDEETYVAHTPQLIWVDDLSDGSLFTAYATRVVFSQKSATSFGYDLQQLPDGDYDTDIYFTLKDGSLRQANQNTTEMNEEIFPEELIGFTTSTGGWIGFGDGCLNIYQSSEAATALPEGVSTTAKSLDFNVLHVRDITIDNATIIEYAEDGDDVYISNPSSGASQWVKGTLDRSSSTVTFRRQYLGLDEGNGFAVWFVPAKYDKSIDYFYDDDPEAGGDWFRTYEMADELTFNLVDGRLVAPEGYALYFSHSPEELLEVGVYARPSITGYESKSLTPASVTFTKYEEYDDLWGFGVMGFGIPSMSEEGIYIPSSELFFRVYPDDSTEPFEFSAEDYIDMEVEPMTDVPYDYFEDFDFKVNGVNHTVYFYHDWKKVGVQVVQKHDGTETCSKIVYSNGNSGLESIDMAPVSPQTIKYLRDGELIILHQGVEYNAQGMRIGNI